MKRKIESKKEKKEKNGRKNISELSNAKDHKPSPMSMNTIKFSLHHLQKYSLPGMRK